MNTNTRIDVALAIAETIRELGEVPSGHLYASAMSHGLSLQQYESVIRALSNVGLVSQDGQHLLRWIGPQF
jgi:hypothetical protein